MIETTIAGRYRLDEQIATGGMGTVWRARDEVLQRPVAIKLLNESLADDPSASERFRREALTAASITHPNMANVYDYFEEAGRPGIVMELVEGHTLAQRIKSDGRLPLDDAVRIACDILVALSAAHAAGVVHRDIKPGNILLTPNGDVKVSDFGIARSLSESSLTVTGTVMGTAHYSAPEQVRGEAATAGSDLYSVGVVLYEMLTGKRPFQGDSAIGVAVARLNEDPTPPRAHRPAIPAALDRAVMRALARAPEDRFPDALSMRDALATTDVTAIDQTAGLVAYGDDETIAYGAPLREEAAGPIRDRVPPRWAGRLVALVLLPLLILGAAMFVIIASVGRGVPLGPEAEPSPTRSAPAVPGCCAVPRLVDLTANQAIAALAAADLRLGSLTSRFSDKPEGTVIAQSVQKGTILEAGDAVGITVSAGPTPTPTKDPDDDDKGSGKGNGRRRD